MIYIDSKFSSIKKNSDYGLNDFNLMLYGVKDIKKIKTIFNKIIKNKKLTFGVEVFKITKLQLYITKTKDSKEELLIKL